MSEIRGSTRASTNRRDSLGSGDPVRFGYQSEHRGGPTAPQDQRFSRVFLRELGRSRDSARPAAQSPSGFRGTLSEPGRHDVEPHRLVGLWRYGRRAGRLRSLGQRRNRMLNGGAGTRIGGWEIAGGELTDGDFQPARDHHPLHDRFGHLFQNDFHQTFAEDRLSGVLEDLDRHLAQQLFGGLKDFETAVADPLPRLVPPRGVEDGMKIELKDPLRLADRLKTERADAEGCRLDLVETGDPAAYVADDRRVDE